MRRALAVVAAAAMIAGALAIRARLDDDKREEAQVLRLVCATELAAACDQLNDDDARIDLTVEAAGVTAERLTSFGGSPRDAGLDGWLVSAPWPDIVDGSRQARSLEPLFGAASTRPVVARSPLVLVVWKDRAAVLAARCGASLGWKCIGEAVDAPGGWAGIGGQPQWGPVKPGHADPETDAGLLILGQATADWFGRSDLSRSDLDDENFSRWFAGLERAVPPSGGSPLNLMLVTGPAAYDVVGTTEAEAGPLLARSPRRAQLDLLYPSPMVTADLVLATPVGDIPAAGSLREVVSGSDGKQALTDAGWKVPGSPGAQPLPSPGFLDALRARWHSVTNR